MRRVFLIDDEPWALADMALSFPWEKYGFCVAGKFTQAAEARQAILTLRPDVVVTDLRMPRLDGIELIKSARESGVDAAFVLVSGVSDFQSARLAIRYGVVEYVLKPLDEEACEEVVRRLAAILYAGVEQATVTPEMKAIQDYIEASLSRKISLGDVASAFHFSASTLGRMFHSELNTTFSQYLEERRMEYAIQLLDNRQMSIGDIACACGYSDQNYFSACFRRRYAMTPTQYRSREGMKQL